MGEGRRDGGDRELLVRNCGRHLQVDNAHLHKLERSVHTHTHTHTHTQAQGVATYIVHVYMYR